MHSTSSPFVLHTPPISSSFIWSFYLWRRGVQFMKLLIMQFSPISRQFVSLRPKYSPQHHVLEHLSLCSFINVRHEVSHPYRVYYYKTFIPTIFTSTFPSTLFSHAKRHSEFRSLLRLMFSLWSRTFFNEELILNSNLMLSRSRDSSVCWLGYGLNDEGIRFRFLKG
jgi:hypothetical protein